MRIEVEPSALIGAGKEIGSLGTQLGALSDVLGGILGSGIASGAADPAGLNFGIKYGRQGDEFAKALAGAANAFKSVGYLLEATGYNYRNADQASTVGGAGPTGGLGPEPSETSPGDTPGFPNGSMVAPPTKWSIIRPFLSIVPFFGAAMTWPSGNAGMMNVTAAQWDNLARGLSVFEGLLGPAKAAVSAQSIPEGGTITKALDDIGQAVTGLGDAAKEVGRSVRDFATGVQESQDSIRRLLDRISIDGAWDTIKGALTGDAMKVIREVAEDVGNVLENFQSQVKGVVGLLEELTTLLGDAATAFQNWIRPVLVGVFGDTAGNAIADVITVYTDIQVGVATGLIGTVSGLVALADVDTWKGMGELAMSVVKDPTLIDDVLVNMGKDFVAWDKWSGDHPGRAAGEAAFNIGSLFVPGGALTKTGSVAKGLSMTRKLLDGGTPDSLPRGLPGLGNNGSPNLPDTTNVPGLPDAPDVDLPSRLPESVLTPNGAGLPNGADTSVRSQGANTAGAAGPSGTGAPVGNNPGGANGSGGSGNGSGSAPTGGSHGGGDSGSSGGANGSGNGSGSAPVGGSHGGGDSGSSGGANGSGNGSGSAPVGGSHGGGDSGSSGQSPSSLAPSSEGGTGNDSGGGTTSGSGSTSGDAAESNTPSHENGEHAGGGDPAKGSDSTGPSDTPDDVGGNGSDGPDGDGRVYSLADGSEHQTSFAPEQLGDNQRVADALQRHGVDRDDFIDLVNRPIDSLTPDERNLITAVRDDLPAPGSDTVMQKVIPPGSFDEHGFFKAGGADSYFDGTYAADNMRGAVTIADDTSHLGTPGAVHDGLRLDYDGTPFLPNDANAHIIRFQADPAAAGAYDVPRHSSMGGSGAQDGWGDPFTGNGFTKAGDDIVPEYIANDIQMREGAEMWEVLDDGTQRLVAVLRFDDAGEASWVKQGNPDE